MSASGNQKPKWSREKTLERFPEALTPMGWSVIQGAFQKNLDDLFHLFFVKKKTTSEVTFFYKNFVYHDISFFGFDKKIELDWVGFLFSNRFFSLVYCLPKNIFKGRKWWKYEARIVLLQQFFNSDWTRLKDQWSTRNSKNRKDWFLFKQKLNLWEPSDAKEILNWIQFHENLSSQFLDDDLAITMMKDSLWGSLLKNKELFQVTEQELAFSLDRFENNASVVASQKWNALKKQLRSDPGYSAFIKIIEDCHCVKDLPFYIQSLNSKSKDLVIEYFDEYAYSRTNWEVANPTLVDDPGQLKNLLSESIESIGNITNIGNIGSMDCFEGNNSIYNWRASPDLKLQANTQITQGNQLTRIRKAYKSINLAFVQLQKLMQMDEQQHVNSYLITGTTRELLLKAGSFLVGHSVIKIKEDIFFMTLQELKIILELRDWSSWFDRILLRRNEYFENKKYFIPPPFLSDKGEPILDLNLKAAIDKKKLKGLARSPGVKEGYLYFVNSAADYPLIPKDAIIYVTSPEPSLSSLFTEINGIATLTGGLLSHGFICAREFGVPGIAGIELSSTKVKNGTRVRIDGNQGCLEFI